jgi:hypothetical protein
MDSYGTTTFRQTTSFRARRCERSEQDRVRAEYEKLQQMAPEALPAPAEEALRILRALYDQMETAAGAAEPLTLEVQQEENPLETGDAPMVPAVVVSGAVTEPGVMTERATAGGEPQNVPESGPIFRREPVPGSFPQRFRRIVVRQTAVQ